MEPDTHISVAQEYDTLRAELLEAKRYVFERPFAIAALAAVGMQFLNQPQRVTLPLAVALVALFNLWFTVNRLQSASRIVAYIQLVLEPSSVHTWVGWETSLRLYRMWLKSKTRQEAVKYVDANLDFKAVPDALMYYPAIYYFHAALIVAAVVAAVLQVEVAPTARVGAFSMAAVVVSLWSLTYFYRWRPSRLRACVY